MVPGIPVEVSRPLLEHSRKSGANRTWEDEEESLRHSEVTFASQFKVFFYCIVVPFHYPKTFNKTCLYVTASSLLSFEELE